MQGLESLNQFQKFVSSLGGLGRYGDTYMIHAEEGETVVPMEVLDRNPVLKKRLFKSMKALGIDPGRYIVGNDLNSLNPVTGQPEFFLKKIFKRLKKAAGDISGYAAPIVGAMYGPAAGALVGAGLGAFKREQPGDPSQWAQMGMLGGLSGIASNLAGGQKMFSGTGLQHGTGTWNPIDIGKHYLTPKSGATPWTDYLKTGGEDSKWKFMEKFSGKTEDQSILENYKKLAADPANAGVPQSVLEAEAKSLFGAKKAVLGGMNLKDAAVLYGLGTAGLGLLIQMTSDDEDVGPPRDVMPEGVAYDWDPKLIYASRGGVMDLQGGGESRGPGTGTSDSIPAMLSDGEFVMTADAVRGAGGGNRREGARRMYEAMDRLEARA